jgi:Tol biopolymer transport system component
MIFANLMQNIAAITNNLIMVKIIITSLLIACLSFHSFAQKIKKKDIVAVESLMQSDDYKQANILINKLQKKHPNNAYLNLLEGICLLNLEGNTKAAIDPLEMATQHYGIYSTKDDYAIEANYHLAQAYHLNYRFDEALQIFKQLQDTIPQKRTNLHQAIQQEITFCNNAIILKKNPVDFRITNLGKAINTEFDEHSPVVSGDENLLMFTSNKQGVGKANTEQILFPEDIYYTQWRDGGWLPSSNIGAAINTNNYDATCSLSSDGKTLILYRNTNKGDLYISNLENEQWTTPKRLPKPINSVYEESHASLSLDGNTMVFTSDRPDGMGAKDIYVVHKLPDGSWGKTNLLNDNVNTEVNEESPFLSYDGNSLFFASEGHNSMGGFDIFKSEKDENGNWQKAVNIGYPINTPGDDLFYIPTLDGQRVYFASERPGGYGRTDIYIIEFPIHDDRSLAVVSGYLFTEKGMPSSKSIITITSKETNEHIGTYKPQTNTGKYTMILPTGVNYRMLIETPGMVSINKDIELPYRVDYKSRHTATYIDPMVIKKQ